MEKGYWGIAHGDSFLGETELCSAVCSSQADTGAQLGAVLG